jgi:hypothetical protein
MLYFLGVVLALRHRATATAQKYMHRQRPVYIRHDGRITPVFRIMTALTVGSPRALVADGILLRRYLRHSLPVYMASNVSVSLRRAVRNLKKLSKRVHHIYHGILVVVMDIQPWHARNPLSKYVVAKIIWGFK